MPTREETNTLEDVYHILRVPCYGDLVGSTFDFSFVFSVSDIYVRYTDVRLCYMSEVYYDRTPIEGRVAM